MTKVVKIAKKGALKDVDIRDLVNTQDSVTAHQGGSWTVAATQSGTWDINSIITTVTVSATKLDIRDLSHSQDSIKIGDGTETVNVDTGNRMEVVENNTGTIATATATASGNTQVIAAPGAGNKIRIKSFLMEPHF